MLKVLKSKKLLWSIGGLGALLLFFYGTVKYDNYRIRTLEQSILEAQIERESAVRQAERIQQAKQIEQVILNRLLETQSEIREQQQRSQRELEVYLNELNRGSYDIEIPEMETATETERTHLINTAFSERIIDSMWQSYCDSVRDGITCPE